MLEILIKYYIAVERHLDKPFKSLKRALSMKMLEIPLENRPRERFLMSGVDTLSDAELLAVILQKGVPGENAVDISNRIIALSGLEKLASLSLKELQAIKGIGPAKAMQIKAVFELNKRIVLPGESKKIQSAKDVYSYLCNKMQNLDRERMIVLHLNARQGIIKMEVVSIGVVNGTMIHPREVFKNAIKESTVNIIVVHNHPSGDVDPSKNDLESTRALVETGKIIGIRVLDHVIIGQKGYFSFKENGRI